MIPFGNVKEGERDLIDLAFSKKKADDRKEWLHKLEVSGGLSFGSHLLNSKLAWHLSRPQHEGDLSVGLH